MPPETEPLEPGFLGLRGTPKIIANATATTLLIGFSIWFYKDMTARMDADQKYMRESLERAIVAASEERVRIWEANSRQHGKINEGLAALEKKIDECLRCLPRTNP